MEPEYNGTRWNDTKETCPVILPISRPTLKEGSPLSCLKFLELERKYLLDIEGYDTMEEPTLRQMVDPDLLAAWAEFVFGKPVDEVTEAELRSTIVNRSRSENNYSKEDMEKLFAGVHMDLLIPDPDWRCEEYFKRIQKLRKEYGMISSLDSEQGKKKLCRFLINGVRPTVLKYKLEGHIELLDKERKDPLACSKLIRQWVKDQDRTHGYVSNISYAPRFSPYGRGRGRGRFHGGRGRGRGRQRFGHFNSSYTRSHGFNRHSTTNSESEKFSNQNSYNGSTPKKVTFQTPTSSTNAANATPSSGAVSGAGERKTSHGSLSCFKCKGPHHLNDCPIPTTQEERKKLVKAWYDKRNSN